MAKGYKTGGRQKGTPNKPTPLKQCLQAVSAAYFEPSVPILDPEIAAQLGVPVGQTVSRFDIDTALMEPKDRAAVHEKLLRYHLPQMQSVAAEMSLSSDASLSIEDRLARLAADNDR